MMHVSCMHMYVYRPLRPCMHKKGMHNACICMDTGLLGLQAAWGGRRHAMRLKSTQARGSQVAGCRASASDDAGRAAAGRSQRWRRSEAAGPRPRTRRQHSAPGPRRTWAASRAGRQYIYIYEYIYVCVCLCVCAYIHMHMRRGGTVIGRVHVARQPSVRRTAGVEET